MSAARALLLVLAGSLVGCGGALPPPAAMEPPQPGCVLPREPARVFAAALEEMQAHDAAADWKPETCRAIAGQFVDAAKRIAEEHRPADATTARYDAGAAWLRCGMRDEARAELRASLAADPNHWPARVPLALLDVEERGAAALDSAIDELARAVEDSKFAPEVTIALARLELMRGSKKLDASCQSSKDDLDCAKLNLHRALAVGWAPPARALDLLALVYLERARRAAAPASATLAPGAERSTANSAELGLARLVAARALAADPGYAPAHNTAGLVRVAEGDLSGALAAFAEAVRLDPAFADAHQNLGALSFEIGDYARAEQAYARAVELGPRDYDARLGHAVALRAVANRGPDASAFARAQAELETCKQLDASRPEAHFDEGLLLMNAPAGDARAQAAQRAHAVAAFEAFMARAGGAEAWRESVTRAKAYIERGSGTSQPSR